MSKDRRRHEPKKPEWDAEHWRQRIAEARQRARAAVGAAGIRRILRIAEVEVITGQTRTCIYRGIAAGTFPAPVPLGGRARGWLEDEIAGWQEQRIAERAAKKAAKEVELTA
jgi:prophage regulatory protein